MYELSADKGYIRAYYSLAVLYDFEGEEEYLDIHKAIIYYKKAVAQGHIEAMNNLGVCYRDGTGVKQDYDEAFKLFKMAAQQGDEFGCLNLSKAYFYGQGTTVDIALSKSWCQKAIDAGNENAVEFMKTIEQKSPNKRGFSLFGRKK